MGFLKIPPGFCVLKDVTLTPTFIPFISDYAFLNQETKIRPPVLLAIKKAWWRREDSVPPESWRGKQMFLGRPSLRKQVCTTESWTLALVCLSIQQEQHRCSLFLYQLHHPGEGPGSLRHHVLNPGSISDHLGSCTYWCTGSIPTIFYSIPGTIHYPRNTECLLCARDYSRL